MLGQHGGQCAAIAMGSDAGKTGHRRVNVGTDAVGLHFTFKLSSILGIAFDSITLAPVCFSHSDGR